MSDQLITCPSCSHQFSITSTITAKIREELDREHQQKQLELQRQTAKKLDEIKLLEQKVKAQEELVKNQEQEIEKKVKEQTDKEKEKLWHIAQAKAAEKFEAKLKMSEEENQKIVQRLKETEENELKLIQKGKELEEKERRMELEKARQIEEERKKIAEESRKAADEEHRMKFLEKEKQLEMMRTQIEELKRKSEQGSMQIQGEVQEEDLKTLLQSTFPIDQILDVEKGVRGADLIQVVRNSAGQQCGIIVWESKNTKEWKDDWVKKLRDDQHLVKGDICVLVTKVLPKGADNHAFINGVWVIKHSLVLLVTHAMRNQLIQLHSMKVSNVGKEEKMEVLYHYLSGSQFKSRVESIVNAFMTMQDQLTAEKRAMNTIWNRREKEIQRIVDQTTGMYGDLQGIIGAALPTVQSLELSSGEDDDEEGQSSLL